jgi:Txe/YoeB family toxin of toxin-antitoxin system
MEIVYSKQAYKDFEKLKEYPALVERVKSIIELIKNNPYTTPPSYEKLVGFENVYSRRINIQHRLIYEVRKEENTIVVMRMWTHYEK